MYDYRHGGNAAFEPEGESLLDLSANINPMGFPKGVEAAIINQIPFLSRYPDSMSRALREGISFFERVDENWIFCGNGASDVIFRLSAYIKPEAALLPAPTFSDYERSLAAVGAKIYYHYLQERSGFRIDETVVRSLLESSSNMVFICNPNNPTGVLTERAVIEELLNCCENTNAVLVVDECFMDFVENSELYTSKPLLERYKNLVILKAFTKIFALPGIRLGYALCGDSSILEGLYEHGPDWTVSNMAQGAGIAAANASVSSTYLKDTVAFVSRERAFLNRELERLGFITFNSAANYVFIRNPYAYSLYEGLNKAGIRIRNCDNYVGLGKGYCRVAVSTEVNNRRFIEAVRRL